MSGDESWDQFQHDLENYRHEEVIAAPVAATIEALPALFVQVEGDQDFADADKMVKFLKDGEDRLAQAKQHALAQTASIDELFRTVDAISEQMRSKRLALDKLVKAEKDNRKNEIIVGAFEAIKAHIEKLNDRIGGRWIPSPNAFIFSDAIKGMKSLDSMRDKVSTALANAKIEANEIADLIERNEKALEALQSPYVLAPDFGAICTKSPEDFDNLIAKRAAEAKEADDKRLEGERERIRQEEADADMHMIVETNQGEQPVANMSRHSRAMLLNVLWHHQGGSSEVGQPIRQILGIGQYDQLTPEQRAEAKWIERLLAAPARIARGD